MDNEPTHNLNNQDKSYKCPDDYAFVSYSDEDAEIVSPHLVILNDLGLNVFHNRGLEKPIDSPPHIEEKIRNSNVFIPFLTPNVTVSSSSGKEIMLAAMHKDKTAILPIYLKEMDLDSYIPSLIGDGSSILQYELSDEEFRNQCNSELNRIKLEIKNENKFWHIKSLKKLFTGGPGSFAYASKGMAESADYLYLSFSHEDINLIFEDMMIFENQKVNLRYDKEIDFNNHDPFDSKWLRDVENLIKQSSQFIFYASEKSLKSSKRMHELQYAIKEEKPVYMVQIEELNQSYPSFEKIIEENPGIIRCNIDEKEYIKR